MVLDKVIVMDDVSGLADKSNKFANFLTISRKYGVTCVYTCVQQGKIGKW